MWLLLAVLLLLNWADHRFACFCLSIIIRSQPPPPPPPPLCLLFPAIIELCLCFFCLFLGLLWFDLIVFGEHHSQEHQDRTGNRCAVCQLMFALLVALHWQAAAAVVCWFAVFSHSSFCLLWYTFNYNNWYRLWKFSETARETKPTTSYCLFFSIDDDDIFFLFLSLRTWWWEFCSMVSICFHHHSLPQWPRHSLPCAAVLRKSPQFCTSLQ